MRRHIQIYTTIRKHSSSAIQCKKSPTQIISGKHFLHLAKKKNNLSLSNMLMKLLSSVLSLFKDLSGKRS